MARVTVEGSRVPCADLPTGQRKTVEYSRGVRERVRRGFYVIVDGPHDDAPAPVSEPAVFGGDEGPVEVSRFAPVEEPEGDAPDPDSDTGEVGPPARNASRDRWAEFLTTRDIDFTASDGRDDLVSIWDRVESLTDGQG